MPFTTAAAIGGIANVGGSLLSGLFGSSASKDAAAAQERAAQQATAVQQGMFNTAQADLQPFMAGGTNALASLQSLLGIGPGGSGPTNPILQMLGIGTNGQPTGGGINPATFQSSPGFQYQLQQGQNAITNAASRTGGIGGNALKSLQSNAMGLANQGWQQYLGNVGSGWGSLTGNLQNLISGGQGAAGAIAGDAIGTGNSIAGNLLGAGNAQAGGIIGSTNGLTGGITGALSGVGGAVQQNALMNYLQSLQNGGGNVGNVTTGSAINPNTGASYQTALTPNDAW